MWQRRLPEIEQALRADLARMLPSRSISHDDLLSETLLGLTQWASSHHLPDDGSPLRVARTILRRRISDQFRVVVRERSWFVELGVDEVEGVPAPSAPVDRQLLIKQMLAVTLAIMGRLNESERDLLALASVGASSAASFTPAERQRLARARRKLADGIVKELGSSVAELLKPDIFSKR